MSCWMRCWPKRTPRHFAPNHWTAAWILRGNIGGGGRSADVCSSRARHCLQRSWWPFWSRHTAGEAKPPLQRWRTFRPLILRPPKHNLGRSRRSLTSNCSRFSPIVPSRSSVRRAIRSLSSSTRSTPPRPKPEPVYNRQDRTSRGSRPGEPGKRRRVVCRLTEKRQRAGRSPKPGGVLRGLWRSRQRFGVRVVFYRFLVRPRENIW